MPLVSSSRSESRSGKTRGRLAGRGRRASGRCLLPLALICGLALTAPLQAAEEKAGTAETASPPPLSEHIVRQASFWKDYSATLPLSGRIYPAPAEVADYITRDNIANDWQGRPEVLSLEELPDPAWRKDLEKALETMPPAVKALVDDRLLAILPVRDLGSTAYTELVSDAQGRPVGGFIAIDIDKTNRPLQEWLAMRDGSPFALPDGLSLQIKTAAEGQPDPGRMETLRFILLHEFGHVAIIGRDWMPLWTEDTGPQQKSCDWPFTCFSWALDSEGRWISRFDENWPKRDSLAFYAREDQKQPVQDLCEHYGPLGQTNFPSLYGATNPWEDFSESLVLYMHNVLMQQPYIISAVRSGETKGETEAASRALFASCFETGRCPEKKAFMDQLFQTDSSGKTASMASFPSSCSSISPVKGQK